MRSASTSPCCENGARLRRNRLRLRRLLARHVALQHRRLDDRPDRLARRAIERVDPALLRRLRDRLPPLPVHRDVHEVRRHRRVVVPDVVMHHLEMPLPLARSSHRSRRGCCRTGCRPGDDRRTRRAAACPSGRTRARAPDPPTTSPTGRSCRRLRCRSSCRSSTSPRRTRRAAGSRLNFQSCLPVRTSKPRTNPGMLCARIG